MRFRQDCPEVLGPRHPGSPVRQTQLLFWELSSCSSFSFRVGSCLHIDPGRWRPILASAYAKATGEDGGSKPIAASSKASQEWDP